MTTLSTSAGTVAYDSRGSGNPVVLLPSGGHDQHDYDDPRTAPRAAETARDLIPGSRLVVIDSGHLPHTTSPAAVAAELTSLANTAFDVGSRVNDAQYNPSAMKEQQQ